MNIRDTYDYYINKGFSILPCGRDKKPLVSTWAELQNSATLVMVATLIIALIVAAMDFSFSRIMELIYSLLY